METTLDQDIKDLVIARLQTLPEGVALSMGSDGDFTKDELIAHIQQGDEIGQKMIELEMSFLRGLKDGIFYGDDFVGHTA